MLRRFLSSTAKLAVSFPQKRSLTTTTSQEALRNALFDEADHGYDPKYISPVALRFAKQIMDYVEGSYGQKFKAGQLLVKEKNAPYLGKVYLKLQDRQMVTLKELTTIVHQTLNEETLLKNETPRMTNNSPGLKRSR